MGALEILFTVWMLVERLMLRRALVAPQWLLFSSLALLSVAKQTHCTLVMIMRLWMSDCCFYTVHFWTSAKRLVLCRSRHANSLAVFFSRFTTPCDSVRWLSHQDLRCVSALLCLMTFWLFDAYRMCWFLSATLWNAQQSIQSLEVCSWKWLKKLMCLSNCGTISPSVGETAS